MVRVRFAPSPTGPLHIGGVRTALYNFLFAKKNKGVFLLRIEDTDQKRYVDFAEEYIKKSLDWCNIKYDEGVDIEGDKGPYRQSERKDIYKKYVKQLIKKGYAYYAFDTKEELESMRENLKKAGVASPKYDSIMREQMKNSLTLPKEEVQKRLSENQQYVVRVKIPRNKEIKLKDIIRGWVVVNSNTIDDKVIFKSDGMPTYHLANVVDDYLMGITHVIRGEEWLPSAPLHVMLYDFLGWNKKMPEFAHLPLILRPDGKGKLSKRDGDKHGFPVFPLKYKTEEGEVEGFKDSGFLSSAFVNMLAFLGWNPGTEKEIFNLEELIDSFSLERVSKSGAKFDFEKTKWFNQQHIRLLNNKNIYEIIKEDFVEHEEEKIIKIIELEKERVLFLSDIVSNSRIYFTGLNINQKEYVFKKTNKEIKDILCDILEKMIKINDFKKENIEIIIREYIDYKNLKFGDLLPLLRFVLTGEKRGPSIYSIIEIIGKDIFKNRVNNFLKNVE